MAVLATENLVHTMKIKFWYQLDTVLWSYIASVHDWSLLPDILWKNRSTAEQTQNFSKTNFYITLETLKVQRANLCAIEYLLNTILATNLYAVTGMVPKLC